MEGKVVRVVQVATEEKVDLEVLAETFHLSRGQRLHLQDQQKEVMAVKGETVVLEGVEGEVVEVQLQVYGLF
jgi:hypothetical protein